MKLLVLGGTEFVGSALLEEGLALGWDVTVLNRGTRPVPVGVRSIVADRRAGLAVDGEWDVVVDTWSWEPRVVRDSARALADHAGRYIYISSRSVHRHPTAKGATEDAPTVDADMNDEHYDDYQRAKRGGELGALDGFGDRAVLLRPGLILGPRENIGRLPWWLGRIARGGDILAPGPADAGFQYVDARDLAAYALSDITPGAYSVVNRAGDSTMGELLESALEVTGSTGVLRWTDPDLLLRAGVEPWMHLPVWIPAGEDHETMHEGDVSKAHAAGLVLRPLRETVADTWRWLQALDGPVPSRPGIGLDPAVEARILN